MVAHFLGQNEEAAQVVVVVLEGLLNALAHGLQAREVDDGVDGMLVEQLLHGRAVAQVGLAEGEVLAGDAADAVQCLGLGVDEIVDDDDLMSRVEQFYASVAADIAGAAGDQYLHNAMTSCIIL